jgi:hypothetical protein
MGEPFELPRGSALITLALIACTAMTEIARLTDEPNVWRVADRICRPPSHLDD